MGIIFFLLIIMKLIVPTSSLFWFTGIYIGIIGADNNNNNNRVDAFQPVGLRNFRKQIIKQSSSTSCCVATDPSTTEAPLFVDDMSNKAVAYKGTLPRYQSGWLLDKHHYFETGRVVTVCGNTYNMLKETKFLKDHFDFIGNFDTHYGIFDGCGTSLPYDKVDANGAGKGASSKGGCC